MGEDPISIPKRRKRMFERPQKRKGWRVGNVKKERDKSKPLEKRGGGIRTTGGLTL